MRTARPRPERAGMPVSGAGEGNSHSPNAPKGFSEPRGKRAFSMKVFFFGILVGHRPFRSAALCAKHEASLRPSPPFPVTIACPVGGFAPSAEARHLAASLLPPDDSAGRFGSRGMRGTAAGRAGKKTAFRPRPNLPFFPRHDPSTRPTVAAGRLSGGMSEAIPPGKTPETSLRETGTKETEK